MKLLFLISFLSFSVAQAGQIFLNPGQSINIGGGTRVVCQPSSVDDPTSPTTPMAPACDVKFNPSGNSCTTYVIYSSNQAQSDCLNELSDVQQKIHELESIGTCSRPVAAPCEAKFNPPGNSCTTYVIYKNGVAMSGCLNDIESDVQPVLEQLRQMGVCARM